MSIYLDLRRHIKDTLHAIYNPPTNDFGLELPMLAHLFDSGLFANAIASHIQNQTLTSSLSTSKFVGIQTWIDKLGYVNAAGMQPTELADAAFVILDIGHVTSPLTWQGLHNRISVNNLKGRLLLIQTKMSTDQPIWHVPGTKSKSANSTTNRQLTIYQKWPKFNYTKHHLSKHPLLNSVSIKKIHPQNPECWYAICGRTKNNAALSGEGWDCGAVISRLPNTPTPCNIELSDLLASFYEQYLYPTGNLPYYPCGNIYGVSAGRNFTTSPPKITANGWDELCTSLLDMALNHTAPRQNLYNLPNISTTSTSSTPYIIPPGSGGSAAIGSILSLSSVHQGTSVASPPLNIKPHSSAEQPQNMKPIMIIIKYQTDKSGKEKNRPGPH